MLANHIEGGLTMSRERQKMFKRMLMLVTIVFLSILSLGVQSVASASEQFDRLDQSNEQEFFTQLNRDITLEQAISEYPAILDYFPIEEVSPSESVDASIPVYDFSNVSAYDLLSSLNARKRSSTEEAFFTQLDSDITLEQAISKYPAILDYFPIEKVPPSESVDAEIPVYDFSNVKAYDLLSSLNARK